MTREDLLERAYETAVEELGVEAEQAALDARATELMEKWLMEYDDDGGPFDTEAWRD